MNTEDSLQDTRQEAAQRRRPYEKPKVLFEEPLELFATVCNPPAKASIASCSAGPISS